MEMQEEGLMDSLLNFPPCKRTHTHTHWRLDFIYTVESIWWSNLSWLLTLVLIIICLQGKRRWRKSGHNSTAHLSVVGLQCNVWNFGLIYSDWNLYWYDTILIFFLFLLSDSNFVPLTMRACNFVYLFIIYK